MLSKIHEIWEKQTENMIEYIVCYHEFYQVSQQELHYQHKTNIPTLDISLHFLKTQIFKQLSKVSHQDFFMTRDVDSSK